MTRTTTKKLRLRGYQRAAVQAVESTHERALTIAACGTGKTLMAVAAVAKLLDGHAGAVLVVFPTLGLLEQTYRTWQQQASFRFAALGVCSAHLRDTEDIHSDDLSIASTTSAQRVADWAAALDGVGVAFCTYQSLPVIAAAHKTHQMAPWAVAVFDEAHRTAGLHGKAFATALNSTKIPAEHRLFYTATPKVHSGPRTRSGKPRRRTVASMDDPDLYGPTVFTLSAREAIDRGILSPYKVAVIAVSNRAVSDALKDVRMVSLAGGDDHIARADHVAAAIALTQAATDYELSSVLAFHNTIAASADFATTFRRVHAVLRAKDLIRDGRAAAIVHIDGTTKLRDRLAATQTLTNPVADQWNIVTNARCLTEGINLPALDAVLFAEPRSSEVDVAQAVGRAIRKNPHHDRPALIVLAVTVDDSQDAETVIDVSEFRRTRQVLKALQTHDPSLSRDLAAIRDQLANSDHPGDVKSDVLDIHLPATLTDRMATQFFQAFSVHTVDTLTRQWEQNFAATQQFAELHGHCNITPGTRSETGADLATWVQHQRGLYNHGRLLAERAERLAALPGWAWNVADAQWESNFAELQQFADTHGHPFPPNNYRSPSGIRLAAWIGNQRRSRLDGNMPIAHEQRFEKLPGWVWNRRDNRWENKFDELTSHLQRHDNQYPFGHGPLAHWVSNQRTQYRAGRLPADKTRRLAALPDWTWTPLDKQWDDNMAALTDYVTHIGHARPPQAFVTDSGFQLGRWVSDLRRRKADIGDARRAQLEALPGWGWAAPQSRWEEFISTLAAFAAEHGHCYPPRDPSRPELAKLNELVVSVRSPARRRRLTDDQCRQLESLPGWTWESRQKATWETTFDALRTYAAQHGHVDPPPNCTTPDGTPLRKWVTEMRAPSRRRKLSADRAARLEALPGWTWNESSAPSWDALYTMLTAYMNEHDNTMPVPDYRTADGIELGKWVDKLRLPSRRRKLSAGNAARLEALPGWSWKGPQRYSAEQIVAALTEFAREHGHTRPTTRYQSPDGLPVGRWAKEFREPARRRSLSADLLAQLEALPGINLNYD